MEIREVASFFVSKMESFETIVNGESRCKALTAQKMNFSIKFSSVNVTKSAGFLQIWSHLLKKSSMKNFIFCTVFHL